MRSNEDITVIIPVVRLEKAKRCIEAVMALAPGVEIVSEFDTDRIGAPRMVKKLVEKSTRPLVMFLGDDTIPEKGFVEASLRALAALPDGWGVVALNSQKSRHAAHFLADKRMLDLLPGQEFFCTEYKHCFCDNELTDIAKEHGRFVFCDEAVVKHDHPIFTGEQEDEHYQRVYQKPTFMHDRCLYYKRKRDRLKGGLGIGFPLVDKLIPATFFLSYASMNKPDAYTLLVPTDPHGSFPHAISAARNSIATQAQDAGCSWLLMMDTDQVYPQDTLTKLFARQLDMCGVLVHRGWPPYDPIMMRGSPNHYDHVPDEECFSGNLVEVDATGTGCVLLNMEVFDELMPPYFSETLVDGRPIGEDIHFCYDLRKLGRRIFVDTSIRVGHLRQICVDRLFYEVFQKLNGGKDDGKDCR